MKYIKIFISALALLATAACSTDLLPFLQFEVENLTGTEDIQLDIDGHCTMERPIRIKASDELEWSIVSSDTWLKFDPASGTGSADIALSAFVNTGYNTRTGSFTVTCDGMTRTFNVSQAPSTQLDIENNIANMTFNYERDTSYVSLRSNTYWTAASNQVWCAVEPTSGQGNARLAIIVAQNEDTENRKATITLRTTNGEKTHTIEVTQGKYGAELTLSTEEMQFPDRASQDKLTITATNEVEITSNQLWCTLNGSNRVQLSGNGEVIVDVTANTSTSSREALLTVKMYKDQHIYDTKTVRVTQAAHVPRLTVSPLSWSPSEERQTTDFTIGTDDNWIAQSDQNWCAPNLTDRGNGSGSLTLLVARNHDEQPRTAHVTVWLPQYPTYKQTITITQAKHEAILKFEDADQKWEGVAASGATRSIHFESSDDWKASVPTEAADWCSITPTSGNSNTTTLTITLKPNTQTTPRETTVSVWTNYRGQEIKVSQQAYNANLSLSTSAITLGENGKADNGAAAIVTITSSDPWTAVANKAWCKVTPASGSGNGQINISADSYTGTEDRTATVTVKNAYATQTITVTQTGHKPHLTINPTLWEPGEARQTTNIDIDTEDTWEVKSDQNWCAPVSTTTGRGKSTLQMVVAANEDVVERTANVTFWLPQYPDIKQTLTVRQAAHQATLVVEASTDKFPVSGGTISLNIQTATNDEWEATSDMDWCKFPNEGFTYKHKGTQMLTVTAKANKYLAARDAKITIRLTKTGLSKTITLHQGAYEPKLVIRDWNNNELTSNSTIAFDADGKPEVANGNTIMIEANDAWKYETTNSLFYVDPKTGTGNGRATVYVYTTDNAEQTGTITIRLSDPNYYSFYKTFKVVKRKKEPTLELSTTNVNFPSSGGMKTVDIKCNDPELSWKVSEYYAWIKCEESQGKGSGTLHINATANETGQKRTATISIYANEKTHTITVTQAGKEAVTPGKDDNGTPTYVRKR